MESVAGVTSVRVARIARVAEVLYRMVTMSPRPIEVRAERAAGISFSKSRSRFVSAHRISNEILRPVIFC